MWPSNFSRGSVNISKKLENLKTKLLIALKQRYPKVSSEHLKPSKIFDHLYLDESKVEISEQRNQTKKLVDIYSEQLKIKPFSLENQITHYLRFKAKHNTESLKKSEELLDSQMYLQQEVLLLRSKSIAITHSTAENERMFSTMNLVKNRL